MSEHWKTPASRALRADGLRVGDIDTSARPGFRGNKKDGERVLAERGKVLADLQEKLYANGRSGDSRSVLLILQGMDTAGKGGIVRHVIGSVDPQGVDHAAFGVPTDEEKRHHFLWRIRKALPAAGSWASSIAHITRMYWSSECTTWFPKKSGGGATPRSMISNRNWPRPG